MVLTERVHSENAPRVMPIINKRSSNIRVSNSYDSNCDTNSRISDHISEQSINNISLNLNQSTDYLNTNSMKKDRISVEANFDARNGTNIRLCNSQTNDLNKSDTGNRQFSPWSAPVRNRVVARVVPYPHTSCNVPNAVHLNSNLTSKSNQNPIHPIRNSTSFVQQNFSRNIYKSYSSYPDRDVPTNKQDTLLSPNNNYIHVINNRDTDALKRRPNYNQPVTYRVKNPDRTPKSFEVRNSSFTAGHTVRSRNYRFSELSELVDKPVTAAEVFGEDCSDLSDIDSIPSYNSPTASRKRKSKLIKCKSSSSDSSSTISVLSTEKQNRFVRVSKPYYHTKKSSVHMKSVSRSKKSITLKPCFSSDEQHQEMHSSKVSRHQMKFSAKEKPQKKNISMKPLTVNVSLTNFDDNKLETDDASSRTTENSSENSSKPLKLQKGCSNLKNTHSSLLLNKRQSVLEKPQKYRSKDHHLSSSSDNNGAEYNDRRFQISSIKSKPYMLNEHENRKMSKYIMDRAYGMKLDEGGNCHKIKVDSDHRFQRNLDYSTSVNNYIVDRRYHGKDESHLYRESNQYNLHNRQRSRSPPLKRQKSNHENLEKISTHRLSDPLVQRSSKPIIRHSSTNKHRDRKKMKPELSSDAVFQKEFDEFKRDQAGDILDGSIKRKCNSSMLSSASSTGTKSLSSFKKLKSKRQELSTSMKYNKGLHDTIDSKNIFEIDMDNINIYESMYDKVKRRAHKQTENKSKQYLRDVSDQRNKRKSKTNNKEINEKMYRKRQRNSHDRTSPSVSLCSGASSQLVDDSLSNYSSTLYPSMNKTAIHRKVIQQTFYKSTKPSVVSSFDSPGVHSIQNWKCKENQERKFYTQKEAHKPRPDSLTHKSKQLDNEDEHDNNSEFSYVTNTSKSINILSKSNHKYRKKNADEIGNGSDATASTEPMEYTEVDLESMKLSDDDWKSGLSSQSSSESGVAMSSSDLHKMEVVDDVRQELSDKIYSPDREIVTDYGLEADIKSELNIKHELLPVVNCSSENESKGHAISTHVIEVEESAKEEQDIAIASIMLKEESDCKSPVDWESRETDDNTISSTFVIENETTDFSKEDTNHVLKSEESEKIEFEISFTEPESSIKDDTTEIIKPVKLSEIEIDCKAEETVKEMCCNDTVSIESAIDSLQSGNAVNGPIISLGLKAQPCTKTTNNSNNSPTDKEDLTSYVKSVIERVKHEQSVENQNKSKCFNKRLKKTSGSSSVSSKPIVAAVVTVANNSTPVSLLMSLQRSPSVSYQSVIVENSNEPGSSMIPCATPNIPGVNVCSPVVATLNNFVNKPIADMINTVAADNSSNKPINTRSNIISIINLSSGTPSLKVDPIVSCVSSSSELKVNTDLASLSSITSDVSSVVTDINTPIGNLKSPNSDDQIKQRICTRLRRADPNKSDGNYKVVMTIPSANGKSVITEVNEPEPVSLKSGIKSDDDLPSIVEIKPSPLLKITDPYEPNFDESPLEMSHYRTKTKNTFFPNEEKSLRSISTDEILPVVSTSTPITLTATSQAYSVTDSVSQVIEDVAHGNFNYSEYLTSFKNGKLTSLQISPSTTPLTFVSTDSRDCSSISGDNQISISIDAGTIGTHRKSNASKHNNTHNSDDVRKVDISSSVSITATSQKHNSSMSIGSYVMAPINVDTSVSNTSKSAASNVSISPIFSTNDVQQCSKDLFALMNPTLLGKPIEQSVPTSKTAPQHCQASSAIQIQPFNIVSNSVAFDKDGALNVTPQLSVESNLQQKISTNNFLNISINPIQSNVNSILSSVVQHTDDKLALKQFYLNVLNQRNHIGGIDSTALSQLQNILKEVQLTTLNIPTENNVYRMPSSMNSIDPSSVTVSNQESGLPQNISSKFIADTIIPREYAMVWEGKLSLKNEEAKVALHFVHGNSGLLNDCMQLLIASGSLQWSSNGSLKIVQRMRLDTSQLEGVQRRMQNSNEYCIALALPGGDDTNQWMRQSQVLSDGFIKYMKEKGAAGIINVCHPENSQQGLYVVHIFPPCEFSTNQLCATAPQLATIIDTHKIPSLLVVITTV